MLKPNSPHYGWGVPYNLERMDVRFGCEHNGVYTVPGINTMSLSILSSKQLKPYDRPGFACGSPGTDRRALCHDRIQ